MHGAVVDVVAAGGGDGAVVVVASASGTSDAYACSDASVEAYWDDSFG